MTKKKESCKQKKVKVVMREFGRGKLKTRAGKVVKNQRQAVAIALSEAREKCNK